MDYLITFLEGIAAFISPCLLPLLPVYVSYFAGQKEKDNKRKTLLNALGFDLGFTPVFVAMGAFAGIAGKLLREYETLVNVITGLIVILFGLNFTGIFQLPFLNNSRGMHMLQKEPGFLSSLVFGLVFSIGWTPCVGVFLGSALMLATQSGETMTGVLMMLCFSLGLGTPFVISALLIDRLKAAFEAIKKHYRTLQLVSGIFLVVIGILMATGAFGKYLSLLSR